MGSPDAANAPSPIWIREGIRELLALIADPEEQRAYGRNVPIAHVPGELRCMWFDDSYWPDDPAFHAAFTPDELTALARFHVAYEAVFEEMGERSPSSVAQLHAHPAWARALEAAAVALRAVPPIRP